MVKIVTRMVARMVRIIPMIIGNVNRIDRIVSNMVRIFTMLVKKVNNNI